MLIYLFRFKQCLKDLKNTLYSKIYNIMSSEVGEHEGKAMFRSTALCAFSVTPFLSYPVSRLPRLLYWDSTQCRAVLRGPFVRMLLPCDAVTVQHHAGELDPVREDFQLVCGILELCSPSSGYWFNMQSTNKCTTWGFRKCTNAKLTSIAVVTPETRYCRKQKQFFYCRHITLLLYLLILY